MLTYELEGILHKKFETESKTASFQAREFVVKTEEQYPQFIKFQLTQDRCQLIDIADAGEKVKVSFDLRGREWNERFFTNLNAWKVEKVAQEEMPEAPEMEPPASFASFPTVEPPAQQNPDERPSVDDLPF